MSVKRDSPRPSISIFSSKRERRLWGWASAVLLAIYSSLGLTPFFAETLNEFGLLGIFFVISFLLVIATIVTHGFNVRLKGYELNVVLGIVATYTLVFVRIGLPVEERTHLIEYGVLAIFIHEAIKERANQGYSVRLPWMLAILITSLFGILDECIQLFLPVRRFDIQDILVNMLAGIMAISASSTLSFTRNYINKKKEK